jgi:hypothetical protein
MVLWNAVRLLSEKGPAYRIPLVIQGPHKVIVQNGSEIYRSFLVERQAAGDPGLTANQPCPWAAGRAAG